MYLFNFETELCIIFVIVILILMFWILEKINDCEFLCIIEKPLQEKEVDKLLFGVMKYS